MDPCRTVSGGGPVASPPAITGRYATIKFVIEYAKSIAKPSLDIHLMSSTTATPDPGDRQGRLLILIVAYHAERTVAKVLGRIPRDLLGLETEILVLDDGSADSTFEQANAASRGGEIHHQIKVLHNPVNQGYGGNQKIGYHYAIANGFDYVALLHGDGQYAPEELPRLLQPLVDRRADAVFGSRMSRGTSALRGGMPLYKFVGNRILTRLQNWMAHSTLSEFHSGYRIYSVDILKRIAFERNTRDFHFDTQIILQLFSIGARIVELPIPTYYGDEICYVNGIGYAWNVLTATLRYRIQGLGLLHDPRYARPAQDADIPYEPKLDFPSTHSWVVNAVPAGAAVLDIGCGDGHVAGALSAAGCRVIGVDSHVPSDPSRFARFLVRDLDGELPDPGERIDHVLALDVIEHLKTPERLAMEIHRLSRRNRDMRLVISTGNVAFIVVRLMLLLGQFNYGRRGILDATHTRLFTFASLRRLLEDHAFVVEQVVGIPAPFPLAVGRGRLSGALVWINQMLIRLSKGLFAFQMLMVCRPIPAADWLIADAVDASLRRVQANQRVEDIAHPAR
jgi:glycosyltransferase involved in cell wall biosynthesis